MIVRRQGGAARARERGLNDRLAEREGELERVRAEQAAEAAGATARLAVLTAEGDQLRVAVAALETERDRLAAEVDGAAAARAHLEQALAQELETARAREQRLNERLAERERELETLRVAHASDAASAATRLEALATECEELRAALAAAEAGGERPGAPRDEAVGAELAEEMLGQEPGAQEALAPVGEPAPRTKAGASGEPTAAATPSRGRSPGALIVVVDANPGWERATPQGHQVVAVPPDDEIAARLAELKPTRVVLNLAGAKALAALAALRAAGCTARVWGCLADAAAGRALALGMIDLVARPLDPDAVLATLGPYARRGTHVVTVGDDVDAFISLRHAMTRQGMSVSMVWNAKQAAELLPMVRPEVVVVDLELPAGEACGIVARLGASEPVPSAVLIRGSKDPTLAFAAALTQAARGRRTVPLREVLTRVLRGSESRPAGRR